MKIIPFMKNMIIAPHGITDIGHCILTNNSINLVKIYGINFIIAKFTDISNNNLFHNIINLVFIYSSIIHFRHDFPKIRINNKIIPKYLFSTILIIISLFNVNLLIFYMSFIHIPNHFRMNIYHIKKLKILNIILYFLIGILCFNLNYIELNNIFKSIIISHIIYQEKYVQNNKIIF